MLRPAFTQAHGFSPFWLLVWAVAIDDARQSRERARRKRQWFAHKPISF
jgi:hypothetical protein